MPFTPLHMGPAMALKVMLGRQFSLTAFGLTQIVMDIEPLIRITRGEWTLHGWTHSFVGATVLGTVVAILGRPVCVAALRIWRRYWRKEGMPWLLEPLPSHSAVAVGALLGAWSHVVFDSLVHSDMQPFWPMASDRLWYQPGSIGAWSLAFLIVGSVSLSWWVWRAWQRRYEVQNQHSGDSSGPPNTRRSEDID